MPTIEDLYTQKNNELVDNFLKTLTSTAVSRRQVSNSLIEHWKCVIKLPYNDTNVNLFLVSSCNLVLSQILYDYNQLGCAEVVHVCYKAIRKIVWCEPSSLYHNHLAESTCDLLHEITEMLDTFINDEKMFVKAGSTVVYLCTLTYLFCMNESLLESIKKALNKRAALQNDCYSDCNELFLLMPSHHVPVQSNQEQISRSIFGFARLITGIDSSRNGQETKTEILPHYTQASISLSRQLSKTIPPVVSHEFLRCLHQGPIFPCLSSSLVATHLQSSTKPALVIKLISLSLHGMQEYIPAVQASSAANLVYQLQVSDTQNMQNTALHLAERSLLRYAIADEKTQPHTDVDMTMLSVFQLLPVPDPSWVQLRLARMMLWQKRYNEAVSKYGELLNSPLCSKKAEERKGKFPIMCLPDFEVFAHEHALGLLLSNKIDELRQLCASSNTLDFVMLIIQTEMFMKLRMFEDAVKTLNRALIVLEFSTIGSNLKDMILDICHFKLEHLSSLHSSLQDNRQLSIFSATNKNKCLPVCPSCNGTSSSSYQNCYQFSKDLAICHLFHEV